ncbi:TonB-dependent receptor [Tellurirhabdus rosea]|uniref:TonB-dependent receptor n=1 Tax=Tellurirhabdus rosea TaxID=2674997 RepID=UPI002254CE37|nr:TonB-dependent receptor plug domain-containing protein [Tellurirhabdus rosea]
MYSKKAFLSTLALFALPFLTAFHWFDSPFPTRLIERLTAYNQTLPREKVYLHTDRPYYAAGETIWLKGYLFDGSSHVADSVSRVLYVDLVNVDTRKVVVNKVYRAQYGYATGEILLPDSMVAGNYLLRAYTGWMRNFSQDEYFQKPLTIFRPNQPPTSATTAAKAELKPDLQIFPEGGQLVEGLEGRVGFKIVGPTGKGLDMTGYVLNAAKDTIAGFQGMHLGMGFFNLTPEPGQEYTAYLNVPDGPRYSYPLPKASPQGFVMMVDNVSNRDNIRVFIRNNKPAATTGNFTLAAQCRGQIVHIAQGDIAKKSSISTIPRSKLPEGVIHLTLFDEQNRPVCERLVFADKGERLKVAITPSKATYAPREKVELDLAVTDPEGKPVRTNLSLAVVDGGQVLEKEPYAADLSTYLLLSSDLRGTIEQPGYYFDPKNADRMQKLDLLMMTQGWRRFTWEEVLKDTYAAARFPVEPGLSLTGQVLRPSQKIAGKVKLTLLFIRPDSTRELLMDETDETGRFGIYDLNFSDSSKVFIQSLTQKGGSNLKITIDNLFSPTVDLVKVPYNPIQFRPDELADYLKRAKEYQEIERQIRRNREVLLQEVTIRKKREQPQDSRKIYGQADVTVKVDQINSAGAFSVLDILRGRVAGLTISGPPTSPVVQIRGAANFQGVVEPLFLLDGMPVSKESVLGIPATDVETVDVLKGASAAIFGSQAGGGVIAILTKRGGANYDWSKDRTPGTLVADLHGYNAVREFYAPKYDQPKPEDVRPDFRPTLLWSPMITTDADGKASVSFFASDARSVLRVQAEGAATDGRPGIGRAVLTVR